MRQGVARLGPTMIHQRESDNSGGLTRVLVVTPRRREAGLILAALERAGIGAKHFASIAKCMSEGERGAELIIVAEEALETAHHFESELEAMMTDVLDPPTVAVLARRRERPEDVAETSLRERLGSMQFTVLERPLRPVNFVSAVRSCLELRRTQQEIRQHVRVQQQQERHLSDQREMLRVITDALPALICSIDREQRYQFNNAAYRAWYGIDAEALRGRSIQDVWGEEEYRTVRPHVVAALNGQAQDFEVELTYPLLGRRYVRAQYIPNVEADGTVRGFFGMVTDLTQRRDAERALIESRQRFAAFMDHLPGAAWVKDHDGHYIYANAEAQRAFDRDIQELLGRADEEIFNPATAQQFRDNDCRVLREGRPVQTIETLRQSDGREHRSIVSKFAIPSPDGTIAGVGGVAIDITDRLAAEQALRESERRYHDLIQALPAAVYTCDAQGKILLYNQAAAELWGRKPNIGEDLWCGSWRIYGPNGDPMPASECPMAVTIRERRAVRDVEIMIERPDGSRRSVLPHPDPIFDASGSLVGAVNMLLDITDRKRHEQALQSLVDCTRETGSDFFGGLVKALAESLRMRCTFVCEIMPGERQRARSMAVCFDGRPAPGFEYELEGTPCEDVARKKTCEYRSGVRSLFPRDVLLEELGAESYMGTPLRAADGRVIGLLGAVDTRPMEGSAPNLSLLQVFAGHAAAELERQRAEHALRCNEEQFRRAIDDAPVPVIVHADDGEIIRVSKTWSRLTGINIGEVRRFDDWLDRYEGGSDRVRAGIGDLFSGRVEAIEVELDITAPGGEQRVWALSASSPGALHDGRRFVVSMAIDITERKRSEEELNRYHELLEQLVRERTTELERSHAQLRLSERMAALGTLSAGLGHDMGNLLLPVRLRLEAMDSKGVPGQLQEDVEAIRKCTDYLQRLANGLRLFALDPEESGGQPHRTELADWWSDIEAFLRNVLPRAVELEQRFADNLPPVAMPRHRLTQAVFNLVQNAGNAMRGRDSGHVVVWAEPGPDSRFIRVGVSDNGPGMSPDVRARCLEPFFTTSTRSISTGLGLSLVHGIVSKAGGSIAIESERGRGTTFILSLPIVDPTPPDQVESDRRAVVSGLDARMKSYVASLLHPMGYDVSFSDTLNGDDEVNLWITVGGESIYSEAEAFATRKIGRRAVVFGYKPDGRPVPQIVCFSRVPKPTVVRETLRLVSDELLSELKDSRVNGVAANQSSLCR
jgi:PAS domain S-box-containing protein